MKPVVDLNVSVIGLGYIGLPTAAILAESGISTTGIDVDEEVIKQLKLGRTHIIEPGLDELIEKHVLNESIRLFTDYQKSDIFLIAVPTPLLSSKEPDLTYVNKVTSSLSGILTPGNLIILESTVPVGTTLALRDNLKKMRPDLNFEEEGEGACIMIAHCPERVLPGNVLHELKYNDRVVGGINKKSSLAAAEFYKNFVKGKIYLTDSKTAELTKLTENSFRDVNIAFANEISSICEEEDVDVWELIDMANKHPRVNILQPGPGVGGHCIAVDPWFIVSSSSENSKLIRAAREVNDSKPQKVISKILKTANSLGENSSLSITSLGLAFKKDIDDLRESPALEIVKEINRMGFKNHFIVEPNISSLPDELNLEKVKLCDLDFGLANSDILLLLVDHQEFYELKTKDLTKVKLIDTRGLLRS